MTDEELIEKMARAIDVAAFENSDDWFDWTHEARAALAVARPIIEAPLRAENEKLRADLLHWKYTVTEMTDTILARIMWDAYAVQAGGKTFDGKPLPTWEELGEERQACWLAAASAAAAAIREGE